MKVNIGFHVDCHRVYTFDITQVFLVLILMFVISGRVVGTVVDSR
jgi:hypothetical protein